MKNLKYILLFFLLVQFSCVEDNTTKIFTELNDITIEDLGTGYIVELGTSLKITPKITTKFNDDSNLTYVWYKYNSSQTTSDTLSYEKVLDVKITDVLPNVVTNIILKITDKSTGIFTQRGTTFVTTGTYSGGTLMICRNGSDYDLSLLKSSSNTLYENIYSNANEGDKLGSESKKIIFTNSHVRNPIAHKSVIVTCHDNTGGVYLDPTILKRKDYMRDKFNLVDFNSDIKITAYASTQGSDVMVVNGKLHSRVNGYEDKAGWDPEWVLLSEPKDYSLSDGITQPFGYPFYGTPLMYDNNHNRFLLNFKGGGFFGQFTQSVITGTAFDPNNMGSNIEMILTGNRNGSPEVMWALMRDKVTKEYSVITFDFEYLSNWTYKFNTKSRVVLPAADYPNLYNGEKFIGGTTRYVGNMNPWPNEVKGISGAFFFLSNNKVYAFNIESLSEGAIIDVATENYTITGITCQQMPEPTEEDKLANFVRIGISVKDNALATKQAGIAFYRLSNIGGLSATKYYSKTGICDEIIAFEEKFD